ncbi:MAG: YgfZ/GcvT domain-containing protein [Acidimicrobiales bacterium]
MTTAPTGTDVVADYEALRHGVGAYRLARDVVTVTGPEAQGYLQGQLSQDVAPLVVGGSVPALLLEPDGKLSALLRVTRTGEDAYALDTDAGFGATVADRLMRFRLRTKVDIEIAAWPCVALRGAGLANLADLADLAGGDPGAAGAAASDATAHHGGPPWALAVDWHGTRGVDVVGPGAEDRVPATARWCGPEAWEALRVEAGIPVMGAELDGRTIAAEAGLVERTVSFTKGCYTGQELVARLDARGNRVARRLCGIVAGDLPAGDTARLVGATLRVAGADKPVGRCTSAAWSPALGAPVALAYLHRSVEVPATLRAALDGDAVGDDADADVVDVADAVDVDARALPLVEG